MIIFDLDGSLADCSHRRHFVDPKKRSSNGLYMNECVGGIFFKRDPITLERTTEPFKPDWKAFFEACDQDKPIQAVCEILHCLFAQEKHVEIWCGRCESVRDKTEKWLLENVKMKYCTRFDPSKHLKMRPIGDYTPDEQLKERWLDEHIASGGKPIEFVFDDRTKVVDMYRKRGIFVFDCNQTREVF